jgi:hypothetical protein
VVMRLIIAPRSTAAQHRPAEWGRLRCETINPQDDNSRAKVQNVPGDSWAVLLAVALELEGPLRLAASSSATFKIQADISALVDLPGRTEFASHTTTTRQVASRHQPDSEWCLRTLTQLTKSRALSIQRATRFWRFSLISPIPRTTESGP